MLFTLLAERYERGSVLISSNLAFSKWEAIFKDPMTTAAAIDRLVHHSVILELNIPSYRMEQAKKKRRKRNERSISREKRMSELEAPPPDLRDLPRLCHPSRANRNQNRRVGGCRRLPPWSGPEVSAQVASLQSLILCFGQHQLRTAGRIRKACNSRRSGEIIVADREK